MFYLGAAQGPLTPQEPDEFRFFFLHELGDESGNAIAQLRLTGRQASDLATQLNGGKSYDEFIQALKERV